MSLAIFQKIAEKKIAEARDKGDLDNLPGKGQPIKIEDDSNVAEDLRLCYKVLKNAGYTPPELEAHKEIMQIEELLANAPDEKARYKAIKKLNYLTMKLGVLKPQSALLEDRQYGGRIVDRLAGENTTPKPEKQS